MNLLNTSINIGSIEVNNRLVMPPMATAKASTNGQVSQELIDYYMEKSKGGYIGLIITEHSFVSLEGKAGKGQLSIARDDDIVGLKKLVYTIHQNKSKVFAQINHAGGAAKQEITGSKPLAPSTIKVPKANVEETSPKEMSLADIEKVVNDFANAALRAKEAGFDGVEIHSAHGYLLNQFFSPLTNKRQDQYSGTTLTGRIQLHLDIIQAIRKVVGETYPVALRLGASDYMEGGITIQDSVFAAQAFERVGVDLLDISGGFCSYRNPFEKKQGYFNELTEAIKQAVQIPVILTGGILEVTVAEQLLEDEKADMIGVGREIMRDSDWAKRAIESLK